MRTPEQIRLESGLNTHQLSERAAVGHASISRIERGQTVRLQALTLQKIAIALIDRFKETGGGTVTVQEYIKAAMVTRDAKLR